MVIALLAKYGLNVVLATQSLAQLDALDKRDERALRPTVFSNIDGLLAFSRVVPQYSFTSDWIVNDWVAQGDHPDVLVRFQAAPSSTCRVRSRTTPCTQWGTRTSPST